MITYSQPVGKPKTYNVQLIAQDKREKVELPEVNTSTILLDERGEPRKVQSVG